MSKLIVLLFCVTSASFTNSKYVSPRSTDVTGWKENVIQTCINVLLEARHSASLPLRTSPGRLCNGLPFPPHYNPVTYMGQTSDELSHVQLLTSAINRQLQLFGDAVILDQIHYPELKTELEDKIAILNMTVLSIMQNIQDAGCKEFIPIRYGLTAQLNCYLSLVQSRLEEIQELNDQLVNERVKRVMALLLHPMVGEAEVLFTELNNNSLIHPVMEGVYGDQYYEAIASFTSTFHTGSQRIQAFQEWISLMETNGDLLSNGIIVLRILLQVELTNPPYPPPDELTDIKQRVDIYSDAVIRLWAHDIRNGDYQAVADFGSPKCVHMIGDIFDEVLPQLIEATYVDDPVNFEAVMEFIGALRWNKHKYTGLSKMLTLVTGDDLILMVAYKIKEAMDNLDGPDSPDLILGKFTQLKLSLPGNVRALIWHKECLLKNFSNDEYLYADADLFDANNRRAFTWIGTNVPNFAQFQLLPKAFGDHLRFNIRNGGYGEQFLDGHTPQDSQRMHVSFRRSEPGFNWKVELGADNNIELENVNLGGYLIAEFMLSPPAPNKRSTFVWTETSLRPQTVVWELQCTE